MAIATPIPSPAVGLTTAEAGARLQEYGSNTLPAPRQTPAWRILLRQFTGTLVIILIIAAVVAFFVGEPVDTLAIGLIVLLNGVLGFVQEWRAETALATLRKMLAPQAVVVRDGVDVTIPTRDLVPGDLIVLGAGDKVPADARLTHAQAIRVDESVLTGESVPASRGIGDEIATGTTLVAGRARAIVTHTGARTAFGQIAQLTGSVTSRKTHLQQQLAQLGRQLGIAALGVAALILAAGILSGRDVVTMFMTALSLAVAIVPEGLPAVVTVTLALGAAAMVRQKALVRRLQAVETLGAASVICTDKTGTLTENKMTATRIWTLPGTYDVTGTGYDPKGHIVRNGHKVRAQDDPLLAQILATGSRCSHAQLRPVAGNWVMTGDPTEGALLTLAFKGWSAASDPAGVAEELPFSSDRKRMSVLTQAGEGPTVYTKGAPEQVLSIATRIAGPDGALPLTDELRGHVSDAFHEMAANGFRVIALAKRSAPDRSLTESDLTFLGLVGMIDPPRPEVRSAIALARSAGIKVIMITGDSPVTATAIASQLGLTVANSLTGAALEQMDDAALAAVLQGDVLFARTRPADKMRIIAALQAADQIVAMTGDGVNDAPALKQADIGVAMGIRGTDAARDSADLVLLDDNFATIVAAIREGRRQYDNVRKFVRYLLASNAGEVVALSLNIAFGGPLVFLATQILWMNLVTDSLTAVALGFEAAEDDQMKHRPRPKSAPILDRSGLIVIACFGTYTGLASLWIFLRFAAVDLDLARTTAFTAMVVFEKFSVFAFRSLRMPIWHIGWFSNPLLLAALTLALGAQLAAVYWPPLQTILHTVPLTIVEWQLIGLLCLPVVVVPELFKSLTYFHNRSQRTTNGN